MLYRAERVLGGACQHQSQLSGRSEMAERGGRVQQQLRGLSGYLSSDSVSNSRGWGSVSVWVPLQVINADAP